jgi:hypothetical protein
MPLANTLARSRLTPEKTSKFSSELAHERYHPLPHVVSARAGDTTVLMDRERGTYHTLNEVSGRIWELLGDEGATSEIVERLLEEYDVSRSQLERDVAATFRQFLADRLIAPGPMPVLASPVGRPPQPASQVIASSRELRVPSVLRCGMMLLVFKTMLKVWGYSQTLDWLRRGVEGVPVGGDVDVEAIKAAEYRVAMGGALYPGRARCLEQSLVLYYLLRRQGVPVKYRQGVQPYPFQAHAWIEYLGEVINDVPEHAGFFAQLPGQLP